MLGKVGVVQSGYSALKATDGENPVSSPSVKFDNLSFGKKTQKNVTSDEFVSRKFDSRENILNKKLSEGNIDKPQALMKKAKRLGKLACQVGHV